MTGCTYECAPCVAETPCPGERGVCLYSEVWQQGGCAYYSPECSAGELPEVVEVPLIHGFGCLAAKRLGYSDVGCLRVDRLDFREGRVQLAFAVRSWAPDGGVVSLPVAELPLPPELLAKWQAAGGGLWCQPSLMGIGCGAELPFIEVGARSGDAGHDFTYDLNQAGLLPAKSIHTALEATWRYTDSTWADSGYFSLPD